MNGKDGGNRMRRGFSKRHFAVTLWGVFVSAVFVAAVMVNSLTEPSFKSILQDEVELSFIRPSRHSTINQHVVNSYVSEGIRFLLTVGVCEYFENGLSAPFSGRDGVTLVTEVNFTFPSNQRASINVLFSLEDENASVYVSQTFLTLENLTLIAKKQVVTGNSTAYVSTRSLEASGSFETVVYWVFHDESSQDHLLNAALEVIYYDGSTYVVVVIPIVVWASVDKKSASQT